MAETEPPPLHEAARTRADSLGATYTEALKRIATEMAVQEEVEVVITNHVEAARAGLRASAFMSQRCYQRREFQVGVGALLFGLAPSAVSTAVLFVPKVAGANPGITHIDFGDWKTWVFLVVLPVILGIAGAALCFYGWFKHHA